LSSFGAGWTMPLFPPIAVYVTKSGGIETVKVLFRLIKERFCQG
jgi:hypothetical protein